MKLEDNSRRRLQQLRSGDVTGLYSDDRPTAGSDAARALTVTVDPLLEVRRVVVHDVDLLRTPEAVRQAFEDAYRAALLRRLPDGPPRPAAGGSGRTRPVARRVRRVSARPTPERLARHQTRYSEALEPRPQRPGERSGSSANGCVSVTVRPGSPRGVIEVDPGWLAAATRTRLGAAITEAFAAAYDRGDQS